ncbi:hypothetical protein OEM_42570 [Mycobacterium intracellulare subsp. yongonense 05-1390]|nr:hypothetical protein OEM_42570 [Mycobacterium intracellulare subsp. yongonense 05-1390]
MALLAGNKPAASADPRAPGWPGGRRPAPGWPGTRPRR